MERLDRQGFLPLSFAEERLWFLHQWALHSAAYNFSQLLRLRGKIDESALETAVRLLIARHEPLRTRYVVVDESPRRIVDDVGAALVIESVDTDATLERRLDEAAHAPFDLARGPLFRAHLFGRSSDEREHTLLLVMHHIVSDVWSRSILTRDLANLYSAEIYGVDPMLPELAVQYADYASWEKSPSTLEGSQRDLAYWKSELSGLPSLDLPFDRPRASERSEKGALDAYTLDAALTARLRTLARQSDATLFMTLLAGLGITLAHYSEQDDLRWERRSPTGRGPSSNRSSDS